MEIQKEEEPPKKIEEDQNTGTQPITPNRFTSSRFEEMRETVTDKTQNTGNLPVNNKEVDQIREPESELG